MTTADAPPRMLEKVRLLDQLRARVREDLETLQRAHELATQGVTHEDARQEGDKDMRSTEASYVARGQALRVVELQEALTALDTLKLREFTADDPVALGALVTVELDEGEAAYFVAPAAGGLDVKIGTLKVRVITPRSPLGQALLGRVVGDDVAWPTPHGEVEGVLARIS